MAEIFIKKYPHIKIDAKIGANLMEVLLDSGQPVASSCGGEGVCRKCKVEIVSGNEILSPFNECEAHAKAMDALSKTERLSCQCWIEKDGALVVHTSYW